MGESLHRNSDHSLQASPHKSIYHRRKTAILELRKLNQIITVRIIGDGRAPVSVSVDRLRGRSYASAASPPHMHGPDPILRKHPQAQTEEHFTKQPDRSLQKYQRHTSKGRCRLSQVTGDPWVMTLRCNTRPWTGKSRY